MRNQISDKIKLVSFLLFLPFVSTRNPLIDGETTGVEFLTELGASKQDIDDMKAGFTKLHTAFCSPAKLDDSKINKVEQCDPITKFPIGVKCRDTSYAGKNPHERRKIQCGPQDQLTKMDEQIDKCILQELERTKTIPPHPMGMTPEEIDKMTRPEFIKRVISIIHQMQSCFEKALN